MPSKLETSIDKFINEIQKRGKLTFAEASKILGISEEQVEEWAKLLQKSKEVTGIQINYPTFGEPEIVATELKKFVEAKEKIVEIKEGRDELEELLEKYAKGKLPEKAEEKKPEKAKEEEKGKVAKFFKPTAEKTQPEAAIAQKEVKELEEELGEIRQVEAVIDKLQNAAEEIEKEVEHTEEEEKQLEKNVQQAKQRLVTLKKSIFLLIDITKKKISEAKRTGLGIQGVKSLREDLKRLEAEIKSIEAAAKPFDRSTVKQRLLKSLEGALGKKKK